MSYASILRELKKRVNPDELGATVQGIREMRSKDLLVELKCSTKSGGRLDTVFKEAVGARGTVRHLIPRIEDEIADLDPITEAEDVEDSVRSFFDKEPEMELMEFWSSIYITYFLIIRIGQAVYKKNYFFDFSSPLRNSYKTTFSKLRLRERVQNRVT